MVGYFDHFVQTKTATSIGRMILRRMKQREFVIIQRYLSNRESSILEIGPGNGEVTELLLKAGYRNYTVVEPNTVMRERLASKGVTVKDYMIPCLSEEDSTYDAIILISVLEHLGNTQQAIIFFDEAWRVLRPRGILFILSPDYTHWKEDFFLCDYTHCNITSVRRTLQLFHNHGFRPLKWIYFSGFFTGRLATIVSHIARLSLFFASCDGIADKLYKLKLSFSRRFLVIGVKDEI